MLEKGSYFIGDPCYVIKNELWQEYCDKSFETQDGYFEIEGVKVFVSRTAYGDGCYSDTNYRYSFPVDAGIIGATPLDNRIVKAGVRDGYMGDLGVKLDFSKPFECKLIDDEGVIAIGDIEIETDCIG